MALADDIRALRDRVLAELNGAHDYYTDTKIAWDIVRQFIAAGHTFSIQNMTTGTVTTQADLAGKARGYVAEQLAEATFQQFISIFENFFLDLLRLWLMAYPQSLSGRKVDFQAILDAPDKHAITLLVVNKELNESCTTGPRAGSGISRTEPISVARQQTRSIGSRRPKLRVTCWPTIGESPTRPMNQRLGDSPATKTGRGLSIPEHYHRQTWELIRKAISDLSNAAIAKVP